MCVVTYFKTMGQAINIFFSFTFLGKHNFFLICSVFGGTKSFM